MKKNILSALLCGVIAFSATIFTSCNAGEQTKNNRKDIIKATETTETADDSNVEKTLIASYEEVVKMRMINSFGKAVISSEHATDGKNALKLWVNGDYQTSAHPVLAIPTKTEFVEKTNFKDVDKIYLDVYNDNDTEQTVYFSYLLKKNAASAPSSETACKIPAKRSATLTFNINRDLMCRFVDLANVLQIRLSFDCATEYNQPYRVFFIDNLRYSVTDKPIDTSGSIRQEDEIESCDSADYLMAWSNINNYIYAPSVLTFNTDSRFIKQGTGSFRVTNVPNYGITGSNDTYNVGWKIKPKISDMRDYYSYSFWIYNDWHEPLMLRASYHYSTGVQYPQQGSEEFELKANDWTYIEVTTEHLLANGVNPKNFNCISVSVWVPRTQSCSFYFDALYLNKTPEEHKNF